MNLKLLLVFIVFNTAISFAQVGIGTTTPNAALDVSSTTQGFLPPRVSLISSNLASPVINPVGGNLANGTMVYNTSTAGIAPNNVIPGYYYWSGSNWIRLGADSNSWLINGNSGTNASVNFLGTTDNVDLVFKRNNLISGKLSQSNTSFGFGSLSNSTISAERIVAIGVNSLKSLSTGSDNIGVGYGALESNASGLQNIAIGSFALSLNTNGSYNTAFGHETLSRNTTGILNTAIGNSSLYNNLIGSSNVGVGYSALQRNFSGSGNVAVGTNAVYNNQTGNNNIGIGESALERNISGVNNVAIGTNSLFNSQTSQNNTSVGHESQLNLLTGEGNTSLGYRSLYLNSGGNYNTAIGFQAINSNNNGNNNVGIGYHTLFYNTSGSGNVAIGSSALMFNTTANFNVAIGSGALQGNTTGENNSAIGCNSLLLNTTGYENTAFGVRAGVSQTSGYMNTYLGYHAGFDVTTGFNNTILGHETGLGLTTGSYNTIIGKANGLPPGLTGNIILADGAGNRRINIDAAGNVGIATISPTAQLHTTGTIRHENLGGTGTRMVVSDAMGNLSTQPIPLAGSIRTVTGSTTLVQSDNGGFVYINSSSASTVTVPSTLTIGFSCVVVRKGTGTVNFVGTGVTLQTARGLNARAQYSALGVIKDTATTATITGDGI